MRLDYDVIVVGGGPAGCAVARDVAAAGFRVLVAEEHQQIGEPLQCAGLISERALALSGVTDGVVLHRLTGARVHAPGGQLLDLQGERVYALAVDRVRFDRELALQAEKSGAEVHTGARVADIELVPGGVRVNIIYRSELRPGVVEISGAKRLTCRLLVGADGHKSLVRRWMNLPEPQEKVPLFAAEVELPGRTDSLVDIFLGSDVSPGWFGWVIPTGCGRARVGVGSAGGAACGLEVGEGQGSGRAARDRVSLRAKNLSGLFKSLVKRFPHIFQGVEIVRYTGGVVPVGFMPRTYAPHALLVGDAACHVKPISGGGIYLGLEAARLCAATVVDALKAGDYSAEFLSRYQRAWEDRLGMEIRCGLHHRDVFLGMSDREMDRIIAFFSRPHWRRLIMRYGDLDYHSLLARHLAFAPLWAQRFVVSSLKLLFNYLPV